MGTMGGGGGGMGAGGGGGGLRRKKGGGITAGNKSLTFISTPGHCLCDSVLHSSWDSSCAWCGGRCAVPDGHCLSDILLLWRRSTAALVFRVGAVSRFHSSVPPFPTCPRPY